jgi:hypothetical protein
MAFESLFRNGSSSSTMSKDLFSNCPKFTFEVKILFIRDLNIVLPEADLKLRTQCGKNFSYPKINTLQKLKIALIADSIG